MSQTKFDSNDPTQPQTLEASFGLLESCLQQLTTFAPVRHPGELLALIPNCPRPTQQLILVELIKYDLAASAIRTEHGTVIHLPRTLEFYWPVVGDVLPADKIPFDLILEELHLRRGRGELPRLEDYRQRYPDLAETIGKWLAAGETNCEPVVEPRSGNALPDLALDSIVDDFHLLKLLGQGAFARVYLARQLTMQRLVALKVSTRGSDEPQALSQLDHAHIVRVYDQREIAQPAVILLYMQYLPGGTLADCIQLAREQPAHALSGKSIIASIDQQLDQANQAVPEQSITRSELAQLSWPETVAWMGIQLAEGLHYAAHKGVLHRDVKPANILLSAEAIPKLVDFNVSCSGLTGRAGAAAYFGGSLAYMSPEQLQVADPTDLFTADQLDGRSDLYALGIVLWELWQGQRPWTLIDLAPNWTAAVSLQQRLRSKPFALCTPAATSTERVLENVLRAVLEVDRERRPQSGHEIAARLKLALHPELAARFDPRPSSVAGRLLSLPIMLLAALIIFGPNTAASIFNYDYNYRRMAALQSIPNILEDFRYVSNWVNGVVYPLGLLLFLTIMLPIARILRRSRQNCSATPAEISALWNIGNKATLICGVLWAVSGMVFAVSFSTLHAEFAIWEALHFFLSLILCGGVAWIYPYFGMTLLAVELYYPQVIATAMHDPEFPQRCQTVRAHSRWYLLSAAAIPLTAVAALVFRQDLPKNLILFGVCVTALGLVASFLAYQKLEETLRQFERVLGASGSHRKV
jgi:serine/threonine protein kinase